MDKKKKSDQYVDLRKRAEEIIKLRPEKLREIPEENIQLLVHELQTHQIELDMQNDELRQIEQKLSILYDQYFELYDLAPVGYFTISKEGLIQKVNLTGAGLLGLDKDKLLNKKFNYFIFPEEQDKYYYLIGQAFQTKTLQSDEFRIVKNGSSVFYANLLCIVFSDVDGINQLRLIIIDIDERKQAEEKLRESEDKFRSVIEQMTDGFVLTSEYGVVIEWNKAQESLTGLKKSDVVGRPIWEAMLKLIPENLKSQSHELSERMQTEIKSILHKDSNWTSNMMEQQIQRPDGSTIIVLNTTFIVQKSTFSYLGITLRDITEHKQAEVLQEKLHELSKMESIGRLTGGIAHDFNNIFMIIQGSTSLGLNRLSKNNFLYGKLEMIQEASERAAGLTRQLLAFSRKQIVDMKVINLNNLVDHLYKILVRIMREDVDLQIMLSKDIGSINVDVGQIEQIIINLSVNAIDAMPEGGELVIKTCNVELDEAYCKIHPDIQSGKYVMLVVSDNGRGMDDATKKHVFEPFFTTKGVGEGTGLGLAAVYGIVKQHNGSIEFCSELGHGTTFKIYLPIVEDEVSVEPKKSTKSEILTVNKTILVVEDEDIIREMAVEFLSILGYNVISANNGVIALLKAEQHPGMIHYMLTDVVMPKMNGRQLADRLQRVYPEMKVLYTSGYTANVIVNHGILETGLNFIYKPYKLEALAKKLRDL